MSPQNRDFFLAHHRCSSPVTHANNHWKLVARMVISRYDLARGFVMARIPAHSSGTGQMFLEDKIHGFKYTYISDENVQQTKWYHSSIVLRKVHQFIIKKPMCYVGKAIYKTHGLHRRSTRDTINPGIRFTKHRSSVHTHYNVHGIRFTIWTEIKTGRVNQEQTQHSTK